MITFFNIKTGEKRTIDPSLIDPTFVEPAITALWNSGNLHVNATRGQDFGWRLGAETLKRIQDVKEDDMLLTRIASSMQRPLEDLNETDILTWLAKDDAAKEAKKNAQAAGNFQQQYARDLQAQGVSQYGENGEIPNEPQLAPPSAPEVSEEDLEAQAAAAAKKNEKSPEQIQKEKDEEDRLMAELEAEEAEEKRKAEEAEAAGSTTGTENQTAAEQNNPEAAKKAVAKSGSKPDNKSNS